MNVRVTHQQSAVQQGRLGKHQQEARLSVCLSVVSEVH